MMRHIRVPRPSFVRVNPVDKSKNRLYKAVPVDFSRDEARGYFWFTPVKKGKAK